MFSKLRLVFSLCLLFLVFSLRAQETYWSISSSATISTTAIANVSAAARAPLGPQKNLDSQNYSLDLDAFLKALKASEEHKTPIYFPNLKGVLEPYTIEKQSVFSPALAAKYPDITSYKGISTSLDGATVFFAVSFKGISVTVHRQKEQSEKQLVFIQKRNGDKTYKLFTDKLNTADKNFVCKTFADGFIEKLGVSSAGFAAKTTVKKYRLAVSASGEYTQYHGGEVSGALAAINETVTRVNAIFEFDLGVQLELVEATTNVIYTDPETDPYGDSLNMEIQSTLTANIGEENYDLGHLFHRDNNNGNAGYVGAVCKDNKKGSAYSSGQFPEGDTYDIDFVAHEMGHQFGANHTWSYESEGTQVQVEPGSGSTIMSYAGIVSGENVAGNASDYFHALSILQINQYLLQSACGTSVITENETPVITPLRSYNLPIATPFLLRGFATDLDSLNSLSYSWEQGDNGVVSAAVFGPQNPVGAAFRSLPPKGVPERYFPSLSNVSLNRLTSDQPALSQWETLATTARSYDFYFTVRDNAPSGAGVAIAKTTLKVMHQIGPFVIQSQNQPKAYQGGDKMSVLWDVARTNGPELDTKTLTALLSENGGLSFTKTLATGILNDGAVDLILPNLAIEKARILLKAENNPFFAVNMANFSIISKPLSLFFVQTEIGVCKSASLNIEGQIQFETPLQNPVVSFEGIPAGVTINSTIGTLSATTMPLELSVLTSSAAAPGTYSITVSVAAESQTQSVGITLNIWNENFENLTVSETLKEQINVFPDQMLQWNEIAGATLYEFQLATNINFGDLTYASTTPFNKAYVNGLSAGITYYWRVKPKNNCASGFFSEPFSFKIATVDCKSNITPLLPVVIGSSDPNTVQATIEFKEDLPLTDLEVSLDIDHSFLSDLVVKLYSPSGKVVVLVANSCGAGENIQAIFSDAGASFICDSKPAISGLVKPLGTFEIFRGESIKGLWRLEVEDVAEADGGSLNSFGMKVCVSGSFRPDEDQDGVFDDGDDQCLNTPLGALVDTKGCSVYRLDDKNFTLALISQSCISSLDGAIEVSAEKTMLYNVEIRNAGGSLINQGNFTNTYQATNLAAGSYGVCITGIEGNIIYETQCYEVQISAPKPLSVLTAVGFSKGELIIGLAGSELYFVSLNGQVTTHSQGKIKLSLKQGLNILEVSTGLSCQGVYKESIYFTPKPSIYPNPVSDVLYLQTPTFQDSNMNIQIHFLSGVLLKEINTKATYEPLPIDTKSWKAGVYVISIWLDGARSSYKVLKE